MQNEIGSDDPRRWITPRRTLNAFPYTKVQVSVDRNLLVQNKTVNPEDNVAGMRFELPQQALMKNDLTILSIIAANPMEMADLFHFA